MAVSVAVIVGGSAEISWTYSPGVLYNFDIKTRFIQLIRIAFLPILSVKNSKPVDSR
jgi:hypothetical protein